MAAIVSATSNRAIEQHVKSDAQQALEKAIVGIKKLVPEINNSEGTAEELVSQFTEHLIRCAPRYYANIKDEYPQEIMNILRKNDPAPEEKAKLVEFYGAFLVIETWSHLLKVLGRGTDDENLSSGFYELSHKLDTQLFPHGTFVDPEFERMPAFETIEECIEKAKDFVSWFEYNRESLVRTLALYPSSTPKLVIEMVELLLHDVQNFQQAIQNQGDVRTELYNLLSDRKRFPDDILRLIVKTGELEKSEEELLSKFKEAGETLDMWIQNAEFLGDKKSLEQIDHLEQIMSRRELKLSSQEIIEQASSGYRNWLEENKNALSDAERSLHEPVWTVVEPPKEINLWGYRLLDTPGYENALHHITGKLDDTLFMAKAFVEEEKAAEIQVLLDAIRNGEVIVNSKDVSEKVRGYSRWMKEQTLEEIYRYVPGAQDRPIEELAVEVRSKLSPGEESLFSKRPAAVELINEKGPLDPSDGRDLDKIHQLFEYFIEDVYFSSLEYLKKMLSSDQEHGTVDCPTNYRYTLRSFSSFCIENKERILYKLASFDHSNLQLESKDPSAPLPKLLQKYLRQSDTIRNGLQNSTSVKGKLYETFVNYKKEIQRDFPTDVIKLMLKDGPLEDEESGFLEKFHEAFKRVIDRVESLGNRELDYDEREDKGHLEYILTRGSDSGSILREGKST